jgi:homospermidine synthase
LWMLENPASGLRVPDDLPHEHILATSKPYLGKFLSLASDWTPLKHYSNAFHGFNRPSIDPTDPWQFKNFLIGEGD